MTITAQIQGAIVYGCATLGLALMFGMLGLLIWAAWRVTRPIKLSEPDGESEADYMASPYGDVPHVLEEQKPVAPAVLSLVLGEA